MRFRAISNETETMGNAQSAAVAVAGGHGFATAASAVIGAAAETVSVVVAAGMLAFASGATDTARKDSC